jgi:hypothetical protein
MFDRTTIHSGPSRIDVHEHRAPTDESVKLLAQLEREAEARVINRIQMPGNDFHGVVHIETDERSAVMRAVAIFDINGKRKRATAEVSATQLHTDSDQPLLKELHTAVANLVAAELLTQMTHGLRIPRWPHGEP